MHELFSNQTWTGVDFYEDDPVIDNWRTEVMTLSMEIHKMLTSDHPRLPLFT